MPHVLMVLIEMGLKVAVMDTLQHQWQSQSKRKEFLIWVMKPRRKRLRLEVMCMLNLRKKL
jgi:hypothetical protein